MEGSNLDRIYILIQQNRFELADRELKAILAKDPEHFEARYLSTMLSIQSEAKDADEKLASFMGLFPDEALSYQLQTLHLINKDREKSAYASIQKAISLDPLEAEYWALKSLLETDLTEFKAALKSADKALELDPSNTVALNARARALTSLGRSEEAQEMADQALYQNPESDYSHYNQGMLYLRRKEYQKAMEHFKEALRIDPNSEAAKEGMILCIKSSNIFFRYYLQYQFWMENLSQRNRWAFLIGFYFGFRILNNIAGSNPQLGWILIPILFAMGFFAISTWIIKPLSDGVLLLHTFGRQLINQNERLSAILVWSFLILGSSALVHHFYSDFELSLDMGLILIGMSMAAGNLYRLESTRLLNQTSFGIIGLGSVLILLALINGESYFGIFLILFLAFQFHTNYLYMRKI